MALPPDDSAMSRTKLKLTPTARIPHLQNLPHQHHRSQCHHEPVPPSPVHQCGRGSCTSRVDAIDVRNFPALEAAIGEGFVKTFSLRDCRPIDASGGGDNWWWFEGRSAKGRYVVDTYLSLKQKKRVR
jgi:hypothetical protein